MHTKGFEPRTGAQHFPTASSQGREPTGYSPIVAFQIQESGDVANAFVKRSSGFTNVDNYALTWVRETKYRKRPGCGAIETQAAVTIDWQ